MANPFWANPFLVNPFWANPFLDLVCDMVGPEGWGPNPEKGGPKISRFCFPLPPPVFVLFFSLSLSGGLLVFFCLSLGVVPRNLVLFLEAWTLKCARLGPWVVV